MEECENRVKTKMKEVYLKCKKEYFRNFLLFLNRDLRHVFFCEEDWSDKRHGCMLYHHLVFLKSAADNYSKWSSYNGVLDDLIFNERSLVPAVVPNSLVTKWEIFTFVGCSRQKDDI